MERFNIQTGTLGSASKRAGEIDHLTLNWIGFILPLFAMLILIDTVLPALLWFYTFSALRSRVEPDDDDGDDDDPFTPAKVMDTPPVRLNAVARPESSQKRRTVPPRRKAA